MWFVVGGCALVACERVGGCLWVFVWVWWLVGLSSLGCMAAISSWGLFATLVLVCFDFAGGLVGFGDLSGV